MLELGARHTRGPEAASLRAGLRPLEAADWPAVEEIYWEGMRSGLATFETSTPTWPEWDLTHLTEPRLVAVVEDEIAGWAALSPVSARRCYRGVADVSIYVAGRWRGRGIGKRLLGALVARAEAAGIWTLQASVFPENRASLALHVGCGFRAVGVRERIAMRDGVWRDTVLLERRSEVIT